MCAIISSNLLPSIVSPWTKVYRLSSQVGVWFGQTFIEPLPDIVGFISSRIDSKSNFMLKSLKILNNFGISLEAEGKSAKKFPYIN